MFLRKNSCHFKVILKRKLEPYQGSIPCGHYFTSLAQPWLPQINRQGRQKLLRPAVTVHHATQIRSPKTYCQFFGGGAGGDWVKPSNSKPEVKNQVVNFVRRGGGEGVPQFLDAVTALCFPKSVHIMRSVFIYGRTIKPEFKHSTLWSNKYSASWSEQLRYEQLRCQVNFHINMWVYFLESLPYDQLISCH